MFKYSNLVLSIVTLVFCFNTGCAPRTLVKKNPGPNDCGVRYYRPKPYLMLKPATDKDGKPVEGYVSIETTTLPDFSEEYSIHVRPGLGSNDTSITLDDGWKLTALNVKVDSQFDENLKAVAEVTKAIPTGGSLERSTQVNVKGINVPFGLYEAVVSKDGCTKRLYGFRYVGFMPFSNCPVEMSGCLPGSCDSTPIYGLVFDHAENVMVFKALSEISGLKASRHVTKNAELPTLDDPRVESLDNANHQLDANRSAIGDADWVQ